ncbi:zinc finger protein with KRAB and SCAN domains 5-like isoform X1 [Erythrolamprus reginae]|uniref:zinc finger protein with KRAB and SCAN domains 5-like isoform X1 n=1 Tax=Erythrolamprus reginae TaxID=121349 RepID=UPI00396C397C
MEKSLEGSGKVPRIVQVMYFKGGPRQLNQPPEVALPQQWEAQWQEFLNTLQPAQTAPWNDVGAFLLAFEQVAEVCQWPREEWVRQLLPAFRAGMEQSLYRLDPRDRSDYAKVKAAILRADALRVEMKRQHFRQCCYQELEGPRRVYSQLQDLCRQWLKPESHTKEQILELIIQEHLLGILPTEAQNWVRECGPKDCVEMVALAEEFLIGHRHAPWQVPLPEASVSSLESEGRQRQHYHHPGASEMTPTRNSALAQPSSAGLQMAATGTAEEPVRVKEELEETPLHWEVMRRSGGSASALEGLLVPTPELDPQTDQPQGAFQERPEHGDQIPSAQFGKRIAGEIKVENFDQASSETEDDFEPLQEEESLDPEFSQLDPQKLLSSRQQKGKTPKKRCLRRRRRACKKKNKYYPSEKRHTCPECGHKCYFYSDLLRHMKRHVEKQRFVCLECGKTYRGQACFKNHQRTHLPPGDNGRRKKAGAKNTGYQTKKEYICFKCGVVKRSQSGLAEHMKVHTDEKTYQCTECGKMFRWQSNLCRHRRLHTNGRSSSRQLRRRGAREPNQGQSNSTQEQKSPLELLGELSTASLIAVSDASPVSRLRRRKSREVERSQIYGLKTLKVMLKKLPSPQKGKSKGPEDCDRRATVLSKTIKRSTVLPGDRPYNSSDCGKAFSRPSPHPYRHEKGAAYCKKRPIPDSVFVEEMTSRGKEAPRDTCPPQQNIKLEGETGEYPICGDQLIPTVSQEEGQTANEASEHQNMKMHSCRKCGYQAEKLGDILKHFRIHNKEKPYRYLDCGNSFGWSSNLMRNQQTLDQQTPMPNVVVAECDVTLSDDEELINFLGKKKPPRHEAGLQNGPKKSSKRSPAAAPPRSAANRLKASPSLRSREWNGKGKSAGPANNVKKSRYEGLEKKHLCLDCGQRTYYLSDLIRHKSAHPNGKPYQCPDCEKIFVHPSFLKIHLKTHKAQKKPMKSLKKTQGERKYTCSKCGHKTYKLSTHLLHMRAHVGESEKSFTCEECGKCFKRNVNLARHKLVHKRSSESVKVRRPSYTMDKEINRGYEEPKKTAEVHVKKIGRRSAAASAASTALREHWHQYKYQQRKKAAEECQKTEESVKENIEVKVEKVVEEPKEEEKHTPELSLRARLERFAYSKNKGNKAVRQEEPAPDPKDSQEEPAPDPKDSQGESAPDPMDSQGESAPDPKDSGEEPAPDPKDSQGESAPDPMDSQGESAPDPKDSGEEPAPDPKDSQGESAPDPMDSREEPALDPMDSRKEPEPDPMDSQEKPELDPKDSQGESAPDPMDSREEPAPDPMDSREEPEPDPKDSQGESAPDPMDSREEPAPDPIDSREEPVLDPKVSAEDLHQECTVCGKTFTHDRQLTDHQNLDAEAKPDRCNECQK